MIPLVYLFALALALFAIGLAGIATERHLVVMMLAVELIFVASIVALIGFFLYNKPVNADSITMLIAIFAIASAEIIALIAFYVYMKHSRIDFDVSKLSKLRW
ncbi:MAG: NADH-quinone oxidoreductase subunit K [Candidatus Micrarchaeota archaeon]|nr:NADH-quinone oxidoreductase subunit K [Candidatus Micrarchaeota archaeon]MDE1833880.1 NADH-quinone oxidoreductase subunit K [Candidatus Micrarchaeota archaeon]MDE1859367.1 NADH-quinone oxidoreductase subunit K [Candidatus Micrarchaeota archaeon]